MTFLDQIKLGWFSLERYVVFVVSSIAFLMKSAFRTVLGLPRVAGKIHLGVKAIEPWGILIAVFALVFTLVEFDEDRMARAWQLLATDAPGNSGKIWALEYLGRARLCHDSVPGFNLLPEYLQESLSDRSCPPREPLIGLDLSPQHETGGGTYLAGVRLERGYLTEVDFSEAILTSANLTDAQLSRADLPGADLSGANLARARLIEADLTAARLVDANLSGARLFQADLPGAFLREAEFPSAFLSQADLSGTDLFRANLSGAQLFRADLGGANLSEADLSDAQLIRANLTGARLFRADLTGARLFRADLTGADLSEADLADAVLDNATLTDVDLENASFMGANLNTANLSGTTGDLRQASAIDGLPLECRQNPARITVAGEPPPFEILAVDCDVDGKPIEVDE